MKKNIISLLEQRVSCIFILFIFLLISPSVSAQRTVDNAYVEIDPNDPTRPLFWHYNTARTKATLINGYCRVETEGYYITWSFRKGIPKAGAVSLYRFDGTILATYQYDEQGRQDGLYTEYYLDGTRKSLSNWCKGIRNGLHYEWHPNGVLSFSGISDNGKWQDTTKGWRSDGKLLSEWNYKNGERKGRCITWLYNDSIAIGKSVNFYDHDIAVDSALYYTYDIYGKEELSSRTLYDKQGLVTLVESFIGDTYTRMDYNNGEIVCLSQYTNGLLSVKTSYSNNKIEGEAMSYYPGTETFYRREQYLQGSLIALIEYDPQGNVRHYKIRDSKDKLVICSEAEYKKMLSK